MSAKIALVRSVSGLVASVLLMKIFCVVVASVLQLAIAGWVQVASVLVSTVPVASMLELAVPLASGLVGIMALACVLVVTVAVEKCVGTNRGSF